MDKSEGDEEAVLLLWEGGEGDWIFIHHCFVTR